uniref:Oligomycin sensitivity conferral protein n=1 Tax=Lynceus sp. MCZ IZ 141354 TaxID=1930659 RepID=A0A9N6ZG80_9CRUS|nr:EOG090X0EB8 [Lynceus sp. MCZ IZ 141354]
MAAPSPFLTLVRKLSTSSVAQQMIKPPIQVFGIEGRYASSLYSAASKQKALDAVEKDLKELQSLVKTDGRLGDFVHNPTLKRQLKKDALASVTKKRNMNELTSNLVQLLAENGRLNRLDQIIESYKTIMAAYRGEVVCEVTSAKPLDAATLKEVESSLKGFLQKGQTLLLTTKVDPSILGGLVVAIGDRFVDMSLASKIQRYAGVLQQPV